MSMPRLLVPSLLLIMAACASPGPRDTESGAGQPARPAESAQPAEASPRAVMAAMTDRCVATVGRHENAAVTGTPTAAMMREDWVQVDGTMEWKGESGQVLRNQWTCDMFRGEDGEWRRRYLSFGPV